MGAVRRLLGHNRSAQPATGTTRRPVRIGTGPIEALWMRVNDGELELAQAEHLAASALDDPDVTPDVLRALVARASDAAVGGGLQAGLQLASLLVSALDRVDDDDDWARVRAEVGCDFIQIARAALVERPDPVLLARAHATGEWALAWGRTHDRKIASMAAFRLGALYLDPYTAGRIVGRFAEQHEIWLTRGLDPANPDDAC